MAGRQSAAAQSYRLSTLDASFIYAESRSGPLHVGWIAFFEGGLDFEQLIQHIEERLDFIPRYRQRLRPAPFSLAHATMEDAPDFRIENHIFRHQLTAGMSEAEAVEEMMRLYGAPVDRSRPLWEIHSFEGLEGERTALITKVHHALVDGVSGVELLRILLDLRPDSAPLGHPARWRPGRPASRLELLVAALEDRSRFAVRAALDYGLELILNPDGIAERARMSAEGARVLASLLTQRLARAPWNSGLVGQRRSLAWLRHSFADFRAIRSAFGGTINDVVLAVLTEGAARYLEHHGYDAVDQDFCVGCPVNVRHTEEQSTLGNRVSMMFPLIPAEPMAIIQRLRLVTAETQRIKAAGLAQALDTLFAIGDVVPPALMRLVGRAGTCALDAASDLLRVLRYRPRAERSILPARGINFIVTNVPGVQVPLYLLGHRCLDQIPVVPLGGTLGYSVAVLSYGQNLYFGMVAAPNLMPDVKLMRFFVDEVFGELMERCRGEQAASINGAAPVRAAGG